ALGSGTSGCTMVGLTGVFLSTVAAGVASVFGSGVCLTIGAGFSLGVPAEISMLGFSASGIAIGVASVLFESSGRGVGSGRTVGAHLGLALTVTGRAQDRCTGQFGGFLCGRASTTLSAASQ